MRHITSKQLNDLSSQAYLLLDAINEDNISISPRRNNNVQYLKPNIKKNTILNFVAKAYGYTSWSDLKITSKGNIDSFLPIYLFKSKSQGVDFIVNNLNGIPTEIANSIINILPFEDNLKYKDFPFISQVCIHWGFKIYKNNNKFELCYNGFNLDENKNALGENINFDSLEALESILQKNIHNIRDSYFGESNKSYINAKQNIADSSLKLVS